MSTAATTTAAAAAALMREWLATSRTAAEAGACIAHRWTHAGLEGMEDSAFAIAAAVLCVCWGRHAVATMRLPDPYSLTSRQARHTGWRRLVRWLPTALLATVAAAVAAAVAIGASAAGRGNEGFAPQSLVGGSRMTWCASLGWLQAERCGCLGWACAVLGAGVVGFAIEATMEGLRTGWFRRGGMRGAFELGGGRVLVPGKTGLYNLGNTCYLNAALQCLSNTIPLAEYFLDFDWRSEVNANNVLGCQGLMADAFGELIYTLWTTQQPAISPAHLRAEVARHCPEFAQSTQEDAQELLTFLLDALHEDLNRVESKPFIEDVECFDPRKERLVAMEAWYNYLRRDKSIIVDVFQGQLRKTLCCQHCGQTKVKFDPFMYLSLPVPDLGEGGAEGRKREGGLSIQDCLDAFTKEETLSGDDSWFCPRCKCHRPATTQLCIWTLPPCLIIHLKRFRVGKGGRRSKVSSHVTYPLSGLDLSDVCLGDTRDDPEYDLYATVNHRGSSHAGHYTAFTLNADGESWCEMDDAGYGGVACERVVSADAYVLFYHMMLPKRRQSCGDGEGVGITKVVRRQSESMPHLWPHNVRLEDIIQEGSPNHHPTLKRIVREDDGEHGWSRRRAATPLLSTAPQTVDAKSEDIARDLDSLTLEPRGDLPTASGAAQCGRSASRGAGDASSSGGVEGEEGSWSDGDGNDSNGSQSLSRISPTEATPPTGDSWDEMAARRDGGEGGGAESPSQPLGFVRGIFAIAAWEVACRRLSSVACRLDCRRSQGRYVRQCVAFALGRLRAWWGGRRWQLWWQEGPRL